MILTIDPGRVHGTCVDFDGKSVLAIGPSGSGKSSLALQLIALGGVLVADDQVTLTTDATGIDVTPPQTISGRIEARNIGILNCPFVTTSRLVLVVDMAAAPKQRLPELQMVKIGPHHVDVIAGKGVNNLPIAAKLLTLFGRIQAPR